MLKKFRDFLQGNLTGSQSSESSSAKCEELLKRWETGELDGHNVDWYVPSNRERIVGAILFLHGHGGIRLTQNPVFTELFERHGLVAVCPDGKRGWWLDVVCEEFDGETTPQAWLLNSIVPMIEERFGIAPPKIGLLGVSMGGQGALQLAYRHASLFPAVAAISPAVDFHQLHGSGIPLDSMFEDAEAARQATVVLNLHPLAWPKFQFFCCDPADHEWFDGAARLGMKLSSSGILHERDLESTSGGHTWEYFNQMAPAAVGHLAASLAKM